VTTLQNARPEAVRRAAPTDQARSSAVLRRIAILRHVDLVFLCRPVLLGPVWTIYAAGALRAGDAVAGMDLFFVSLLVAGVYVHNQLMDVESDRANGKLFLLAGGYVSRRAAWLLVAATWLAALAWAATEGPRFWLYALALALGLAYNGLALSWKARPWAGLVANALAHGPVTFLAGYTAAMHDLSAFAAGALASAPYATAVAAVFLSTTIVDRAGDAAAGKITWAARYGERATGRLIAALVAASVVAAWLVGDLWMVAASAVALPWAVALACDSSPRTAERTAKAAVTALALAAAVRWPPLAAIAAITFLAARAYYRLRFGLRYPTFGASA